MEENEEHLNLIVIDSDEEQEEIKLVNESNEILTSFSIEFNAKNQALISYETEPNHQHKGYASIGLDMVANYLFKKGIIVLELIDLTGDYSRKVAENAGFYEVGSGLTCFRRVNPEAELIAPNEKWINKIEGYRNKERKYIEKLAMKLSSLKEMLAIENDSSRKKEIEEEIMHLERVLNSRNESISNKR